MAGTNLLLDADEQAGIKRKFDTSRIYFAEVMDTRDPLHTGRLKVWLVSSNTDKGNRDNWMIARHSSGFYGTTPLQANGTKLSPSSFGDVNSIPYPGTIVAVFFPPVVGENVLPYWFSCPVDDTMNRMAAGLGGNPPFKEIDPIEVEENKKITTPQVVGSLMAGVEGQGLAKDLLRGYASNTPDRGDFPTSYSFTTPLGNTITMDDGWSVIDPVGNWDTKPENNNIEVNGQQHDSIDWNGDMASPTVNTRFNAGIRLRTRSGTQVLISDNGNIYAINKNGTAWVEVSDDGNIDCWAQSGINLSTNGDLNIHSGGDINLESSGKINMVSSEMYIGTSKVNLDAQDVDVSGGIKSASIQSADGVVNQFTSSNAQINGTFQGTLNGMASISNLCTFSGSTLPDPKLVEAEKPLVVETESRLIPGQINYVNDKPETETQFTICSRLPTEEPYSVHSINDMFPTEEELKEIRKLMDKKENTNG